MSLTSYRAAPPRVTVALLCWRWPVLALACIGVGLCLVLLCVAWFVLCRAVSRCMARFRAPGGDRLSRTLGCSIIGAGGFHVRVRDGIGWGPAAMATRCPEPTLRIPRRCGMRLGSGSGWNVCACDRHGLLWCASLPVPCPWCGAGVGGCCAGWRGVEPFGRLGPVS